MGFFLLLLKSPKVVDCEVLLPHVDSYALFHSEDSPSLLNGQHLSHLSFDEILLLLLHLLNHKDCLYCRGVI